MYNRLGTGSVRVWVPVGERSQYVPQTDSPLPLTSGGTPNHRSPHESPTWTDLLRHKIKRKCVVTNVEQYAQRLPDVDRSPLMKRINYFYDITNCRWVGYWVRLLHTSSWSCHGVWHSRWGRLKTFPKLLEKTQTKTESLYYPIQVQRFQERTGL